MNAQEIITSVKQYIRDDKAKYAVLINGPWGCGKTYLYEHYILETIENIESKKSKRKKTAYISLYGLSSVDILAKELVTNQWIYSNIKNDTAKKTVKNISGVLGVVSKVFSFSCEFVSANTENVSDEILELLDIKDQVICFDDLERCAIPINELFGFVNNLTEHCNCKVIILADENNIGKMYANTNIEQKYLSILTGGRKVIPENDNNNNGSYDSNTGKKQAYSDELSIKQLKKLNGLLYSENFIYKDIKEKVIGKTWYYYPDLKDTIEEIICGKDENKGYLVDCPYRKHLINNIDDIVSYFREIDNRNFRIVLLWIDSYRNIYDLTYKNFSGDEYYDDILNEFMRYSIWYVCAKAQNIKLKSTNTREEYVYYDERRYIYIRRYGFIDRCINKGICNESELCNSAREIISYKIRNEKNIKKRNHKSSVGNALFELEQWYYMDDNEVIKKIDNLIQELKDEKYEFYDYSNILIMLLVLKNRNLYKGDINNIQQIMFNLIEKDQEIKEFVVYHKTFESQSMQDDFNKLYTPLVDKRNEKNKQLGAKEIEEKNIYNSADVFSSHCRENCEYYCDKRTFIEFIDDSKLIELIKNSNNQGIYEILDGFKAVYYMGNSREFYEDDIDGLENIRSKVSVLINEEKGITRKYALEILKIGLEKEMQKLGWSEEGI